MTVHRGITSLRAPRNRLATVAVVAVLMTTAVASPSRADLVIEVLNSTTAAGGTGSFDVVLTDTGPINSFQVGGFSVELLVAAGTGIHFTAVDTNTVAAPYIFGTYQSGPAPFSFDTFPNTEFTASDSTAVAPGYVTVNPGDTFGLAHVSYSVDPGTPSEMVPVMLQDIGGGTSLSDGNGAPLDFTTTTGIITVPESSALMMSGVIATGIGIALYRRRVPVSA